MYFSESTFDSLQLDYARTAELRNEYIDSIYFEAAEELGKILAQKHINLINGAGCLGLDRKSVV